MGNFNKFSFPSFFLYFLFSVVNEQERKKSYFCPAINRYSYVGQAQVLGTHSVKDTRKTQPRPRQSLRDLVSPNRTFQTSLWATPTKAPACPTTSGAMIRICIGDGTQSRQQPQRSVYQILSLEAVLCCPMAMRRSPNGIRAQFSMHLSDLTSSYNLKSTWTLCGSQEAQVSTRSICVSFCG